ncbi:aspartate ammonia-lyase [Corallococcus sp. H22C18031201]|nr:aspartate ammonia-lyase [Corallococcus sp. H22C18031201]
MPVVPSVLDAVTVHAEGALCTRLLSVPSEGGRFPAEVRIEGLPLSLRVGSLRARVVEGPAGLVVRGIQPLFDVRLPTEADLPAERHALERAERARADVSARLEQTRRDIQELMELKPTALPNRKGEPPRQTPLSATLALAEFVDAELSALSSRRLELEREERDAQAELDLRRARIREQSGAARGQRAQLYRAAVLSLAGPLTSEGPARIALEYAVTGARWVPTYDLRLPRSLQDGTLRMRASVLQLTGEDWSGVRLSVSTADLERRAEVPELKALRIGRSQPPPPRSGWREPAAGLDELFAGYDSAPPPVRPRKPMSPPAAAPKNMPDLRVGGGSAPRDAVANIATYGAMDGAMPVPPPPPRAPAPGGGLPSPSRPAAPPQAIAPASSRGGGMMRNQEKSKKRSAEPAPKELLMEADEPSFGGEPEMALDDEGGAPSPSQDVSEPQLEVSESLLDYQQLTLMSAEVPGARGRLRPRPTDASRELLALTAVRVQVDVVTLLATQEQRARGIHNVPAPTWTVPPRESAQHFDARFEVEARAEVPSDGAWHTVPLLAVPVGLVAEYLCVPSVEPRAFRTLRIENRTAHPLLAGPVDVTLGEEFLMTSPLPTLAPGATQRLGLGVEEAIKVARNTRFDESSGGMFGGNTLLTHQVLIDVANRLGHRVTLEVQERLPVVPPSEKDIKVDEAEVAPGWQKRALLPGETVVEGERAWRVALQPGESQTLKATWTIKIPAAKMLDGGNRRT